MKKQVITMMAVAAFFATLAVTSLPAQNAGSISVSIPFDFAVSGKTLPAGEYYVQRSTEGARVVTTIRNRDKTEAVYLPQSHPVQAHEIQPESKLVFNKYGNQFFLSQVWVSGRSVGDELAKTARERGLQRDIARNQLKPEVDLKWPPFIEEIDVPEKMYIIQKRLASKGFSSGDIEKILGGNFFRVYKEILG